MIYITYRKSNFDNSSIINNVWEVNCNNVQEKYIEFMHVKAKEINVVINPHWLNDSFSWFMNMCGDKISCR